MAELQTKLNNKIYDYNMNGFYYDSQKNNPFMSVTLHANTTRAVNSDGKVEWRKWKDGDKYFNGEFLEYMSEKPSTSEGEHWSALYNAIPIASSILKSDLSFDLNNSWTDFDGGNAIESLFNSAKPYAPIIGKISQGLKKGLEKFNSDPNHPVGSAVVDILNKGAGFISEIGENASKFLNKSLIVQGTRFAYYSGSSTDFGTLQMQFTLFADWLPNYDDPTDPNLKFTTVYDQLNRIYPYSIGGYESYKDDEGLKLNSLIDGAGDFVSNYVGWQTPPGGFEMGSLNVDICMKGTLRLVIGGFYSIENLVISNMHVELSKAMTKYPVLPEDENYGNITPLYANVSIVLRPVTIYTDRALMQITNNKGMERILNSIRESNISKIDNESKKTKNGGTEEPVKTGGKTITTKNGEKVKVVGEIHI